MTKRERERDDAYGWIIREWIKWVEIWGTPRGHSNLPLNEHILSLIVVFGLCLCVRGGTRGGGWPADMCEAGHPLSACCSFRRDANGEGLEALTVELKTARRSCVTVANVYRPPVVGWPGQESRDQETQKGSQQVS